jgi:hypothetical protein
VSPNGARRGEPNGVLRLSGSRASNGLRVLGGQGPELIVVPFDVLRFHWWRTAFAITSPTVGVLGERNIR